LGTDPLIKRWKEEKVRTPVPSLKKRRKHCSFAPRTAAQSDQRSFHWGFCIRSLIGNSFSQNAARYLPQLDNEVDYQNLTPNPL